MSTPNPDFKKIFEALFRDEFTPIKDMTPAQIHMKFGPEVADYVIELRTAIWVWRKIANGRN